MIYFDNSATTLHKPPGVAEAVAGAVTTLGNPGRGSYPAAIAAARAVLAARRQVATLTGLDDPMRVAFTSGTTESLNLIINALVKPGDAVITTLLEHNSVLRPLYGTGCTLDFLGCDDAGELQLDELPRLLRPNTRLLVCAHGSNLLGSIAPLATLRRFCADNGLVLVVDAAQSLGSIPVGGDDAHLVCFSGHKSLFGPQGTGGVIAGAGAPHLIYKTGGTGADSYAKNQPLEMPDMFEAGTPNLPGLAGLAEGVRYVRGCGLEAIGQREYTLCARFLEGIRGIRGLVLYGSHAAEGRLPVVPLNLRGMDSEELSLRLWEGYGIATRPGSHCAPLAHRRFGTRAVGMVRFSFGWFNTPDEIDTAVEALWQIAKAAG